jgi:hypothetical protein
MVSGHSYAKALRCIGQLLEQRDIVAFELRYGKDECRLQCGGTSSDLALINLSFSEQKILSFEALGRAKRGGLSKPPDFNSLSEVLRAVGRFVDNKGGHLCRICNVDSSEPTGDSINLEYKDFRGQLRVEKFSAALLYERLTRMYKERS